MEQSKKEKIEERLLEVEMKESYLDYAMSVIVSRALPDIRDGLKPVQRRILYSMWQMGLKAGTKFRKSAAVIGHILGKYHPHGDMAVYDAMVRMAQDFSLRYPLIEGQGNFGSIDSDSAAAYRYTEARLSSVAEELLFDLEKETVDWMPNYDGTTNEPIVLPAKLPNLLLNGATGIAVGVATNIPPHNLSEVCDALVYLIEHPEAEISELMNFVLGPDFPTGGIILGGENLKEGYNFGKGKFILRAKTEISGGQIVITEIPYLVAKSTILEKIAALVEEKKIQEIKNIRDLSDRKGVRIVIDLKKGVHLERLLNRLFILSPLEVSFHFNFLGLVDGIEVRSLSFKSILEKFLEHRKVVLKRRTEWEFKKVSRRIHVLEGFEIALRNISKVIKIIKEARDKEKAKITLKKELALSEEQAMGILELRLWQLSRLEVQKVKDELKELREKKKNLGLILAQPKKISELIKDELMDLKERYGDKRKTKIIQAVPKELREEDLIADEPTMVILTQDGYIRRVSPEQFRVQERGGKGTVVVKTKETVLLAHLIFCSTVSELLFFTDKGKVFKLKTFEISEKGKTARGEAIVNFFSLSAGEKISSILVRTPKNAQRFLLLATKKGLIKRVEKENFENIRKTGLLAINLEKDDQLISVKPSTGDDEVLLISRDGQSIRFSEKEMRKLSRGAKGIRGMKLSASDEIITLEIASENRSPQAKIFTITEQGFGKVSLISYFRSQRRGGSGIKCHRTTVKTGKLARAIFIDEKNFPEKIKGDLVITSYQGQILRIPFKSIPVLGRVSQGVRLIRFKEKGDKVASITLI